MHTKVSKKKTAEQYYCHHYGTLIVNFEQNQYIIQVFLLLALSVFYVLEFCINKCEMITELTSK